MKALGFILQASYKVVSQPDGRRIPVVHLYGRLPDGGTFLIRDDRQRAHFHIRTMDTERARGLRIPEPQATTRKTFAGLSVSRVEVETPSDVPNVRDRLHHAGIDTFEADVLFAVRYLIERGIKGGCEIEGDASPGTGVTWIFENPSLLPADVEIEPRVLSFDIETDAKAERLLAIALYGPDTDEVLIVDGSQRSMPEHAIGLQNEREVLDAFCDRIARIDPDVLTGWNIVDFDLSVLARVALRVRHPLNLGRDKGALRIRKAETYFGSGNASIPGRLVLDGIDLLRGAFVRMDDYSLDAVARVVLGEGKALAGDVEDRVNEIGHNYRHNLAAFAFYARTDARLAFDIVSRLNLIPLAFKRSKFAGMTPDRVAASIASFDFLYLTELRRQDVVAPTVRADDARVYAAQQGGHVLEPVTGLHRNVWVFDFKSLYPSIIRTFNVDPLAYVAEALPGADLIEMPGGSFRRERGILPRMLDELFPRREAAKKAGDDVAANALKILMNSFYGVLGTPACRFHNPAIANAITGQGRDLLLWSKAWFEGAGFNVLYGDTDSLFVHSGSDDPVQAREQGSKLAVALNDELTRYISKRWKVTSRLELEFEKLYLKLFLPQVRQGSGGARKRYAGLLDNKDANAIEFVGMEVVRRDWTDLAKQVQREIYRRLFSDLPVSEYLEEMVEKVRAGELDRLLVYRKNLRKGTEAYTATTPPHVVAARKSIRPPQRLVSYLITTAGPEPIDNVQHPIDREHYVEKQIKPVAEPILATLGLDFDRVIGDNRQLDLLSILDETVAPTR
jgi:DNA polymerase II